MEEFYWSGIKENPRIFAEENIFQNVWVRQISDISLWNSCDAVPRTKFSRNIYLANKLIWMRKCRIKDKAEKKQRQKYSGESIQETSRTERWTIEYFYNQISYKTARIYIVSFRKFLPFQSAKVFEYCARWSHRCQENSISRKATKSRSCVSMKVHRTDNSTEISVSINCSLEKIGKLNFL